MLNRLTLKNFKAFKLLDLELSPITLLSGLNASGKSSALQAIGLIKQAHIEGAMEHAGLNLNGELVSLGAGRDVLHEDYDSTGTPTPRINIRLSEPGRDYDWTIDYEADADILSLSHSSKEQAEVFLNRPFQYLHADRIGPEPYYPKSYESVRRMGWLGSHGEHSINYLRLHRDDAVGNILLSHDRAATAGLLDLVMAWMQDVSPGVNLDVSAIPNTDLVGLSYGFDGTAGIAASNRYRPTNVGFGLTYVLPVVVALVSAQPTSLLLIENPEAHLHPRGQTAMAYLAARAIHDGAQVIVESHSDHFLNGLRLAVRDGLIQASQVGLHYFERRIAKQPSVESLQMNDEGRISAWPIGFFDEWETALTRLLG